MNIIHDYSTVYLFVLKVKVLIFNKCLCKHDLSSYVNHDCN